MMLVITLFLGLVCCSVLFMYQLKKNQRLKQADVQRCLTKLEVLKDLLLHIQQHRGLSTGFLHGDVSLKLNMMSTMNTVKNLWLSLARDYPKLTQDALFEGVSSHWQRLESRCLELTASNNIEQHNRLITNLLHLIENQAEENRLLIRFSRELGLNVIWKELLETIEAIGQTRAIGMGLVSEGKSTAVERIQLKYLNEKVLTRLVALNTSFAGDSGAVNASHVLEKCSVDPFIKTADAKIAELHAFIHKNLLQPKINTISGEDFFQLASSAIVPLNALFNLASNTLKEQCCLKSKGW
ncbi:MAG: hypothetical protein ACI9T7_001506 [Oleiphilaceae bacterium]|jgi:hypothetical protein